MTTAEINAAIAESMGWHFDAEFPEYPWMDGEGEGHRSIPDFHGSLDAIVPVIRALDEDDFESVMDWLGYRVLATPAQWSEAYLRWKGLWK